MQSYLSARSGEIPRGSIRRVVGLLLWCSVAVLVSCGRPSVGVSIPADVSNELSGDVVAGGMIVGHVVGFAGGSENRVATVEFSDPDLGRYVLRQGVRVWIESTDQGEVLEFDLTSVGEEQLPGGTVLVAQRRDPVDRAEAYAQRWARNGTLMVVGVGAVVVLILAFALRSLLGSIGGLILVVFSSAMAAGLAYLLNGPAAALLVRFIYPHLDGPGSDLGAEYGLSPQVVRGIADPRAVAFLVVGLPVFLLVMSLVRSATRQRKERVS